MKTTKTGVLVILLVLGMLDTALPTVARMTLSREHPRRFWTGRHLQGPPEDSQACPPEACEETVFEIALPEAYWESRRGGVEVSIRWPSRQSNLDLHVYRDGQLSGSSTGGFSAAESVLLRSPADGRYEVRVIAVGSTSTTYEGLLQLEGRKKGAGALLPDLSPKKPTDLRVVAPMQEAEREAVPYRDAQHFSCYVSENEETGAERCLRFTSVVKNVGIGSLHMRLGEQDNTVFQSIFRADGSKRTRRAGTYELHAGHEHFHLVDFTLFSLQQVDPQSGAPLSDQVRGTHKTGFCLIDGLLLAWGRRDTGARTYAWPCTGRTEDKSESMGLSAGWGDVYIWSLPDQYVDLTNAEDGVYRLTTTLDPSGRWREADDQNNTKTIYLRIIGDDVEVIPRP